jgi:hypothetical protein
VCAALVARSPAGERGDGLAVPAVAGLERVAAGELEVGEVEARRNRAAHEREAGAAGHAGAEPRAGRDHDLELLAALDVEAEPVLEQRARGRQLDHEERRAGVEVPDLVGSETVQRGDFTGLQQEVDGRGSAKPGGVNVEAAR